MFANSCYLSPPSGGRIDVRLSSWQRHRKLGTPSTGRRPKYGQNTLKRVFRSHSNLLGVEVYKRFDKSWSDSFLVGFYWYRCVLYYRWPKPSLPFRRWTTCCSMISPFFHLGKFPRGRKQRQIFQAYWELIFGCIVTQYSDCSTVEIALENP